MNSDKRNEVMAFFWFVVSALLLLSLASYTPEDIAFEISAPNYPKHNFAGPAGAYMAWALLLLFGKTSYLLVPLFLIWALLQWSGKKSQKPWLRIFSTVIFFSSACALFSLVAQETLTGRFEAGGLIGFYLSGAISGIFGNAGIFVALSLFILSIILATELLVLQIASGVVKKSAETLLPLILKNPEDAVKNPAPKDRPLPLNARVPAASNPQPKAAAREAVAPKPAPVAPAPASAREAVPPSKPEIKISIPKPEPAKVQEAPKPLKASTDKDKKAEEPSEEVLGAYKLPPLDLLQVPAAIDSTGLKANLEESSRVLENTLLDFGVDAKVVEVEQGPTITRYELQPAAGVKVQKVTSLENDIALAMRAHSVRIVAPIPGKSRIGIEVPNASAATVYIREVLSSQEYQNEKSKIPIVIGKDTAGAPIVCNLADMPHLLIAGATNTGKSVCINAIIASILFRSTPEEVRFLMIDPKMVELHFYNDLPHLICPVIIDKSKAPGALAWLISEMERRYTVFNKVGAKNIVMFNDKVEKKEIRPELLTHNNVENDEPIIVKKIPYILLVIDELADLMLASANEVETAITRLAQLARAVGIHMILATQRPSVDIITGVIKANFPARIAFQVASKVDSRTILDENGADKLLGRGDLLLMDPRKSKLIRAQGAWVQDTEIEKMTTFIKAQRKPVFQEGIIQQGGSGKVPGGEFTRDEVYKDVKRVVLESGQASVSMIQRRLGLGYTRAARFMDMLEEDGVVGPYRGSKPREILVELPNKQTAEEEKA